MKKLYNIFTFVTLSVLFACNSSDNTQYKKEYVFDLTDMRECIPNNIKCYDINLEQSDSVQLDPNANMLIDKSNIFVYVDGPIYRFNREGQFLNRIGRIGHASNEYTELKDACIDSISNTIEILTHSLIKRYDYDGHFNGNAKTDIFATSFIHDKGYYWFYTGVNTFYSKYEIIRTDKNLQKTKEFINRGYKIPCVNRSFCKGVIKSYKYYFSNDIYHIEKDEIVPAYKLIFPNLEMPESFGHGEMDEKFAEALEKENYSTVEMFLENQRFLFLLIERYIDRNSHYYYWIIDKNNEKECVYDIGEKKELADSYSLNPRVLDENNVLYFLGHVNMQPDEESIHVIGMDLSKLF